MIDGTKKANISEIKIMFDYNVLESMADWVRVIDKEGIVIYANVAMTKALGDNFVGKSCFKAYCREERCEFCITNRSMETGETVQKEEIINGRHYSVKSSPVKDHLGRVVAAVEVFRDVTRERQLELELIEKNKITSRDLQFARRIQERILPSPGNINGLEIDYIFQPSEMLSGDMFDIYYIDEINIGIYICDVAGHGMAASMLTMFIKNTMRNIKAEITSPGLALEELHTRFSKLEFDAEKYFTIFYGVYNKNTRIFTYSNAGHNCYPIKFNNLEVEPLKIKGYPISLLFDKIIYDEKNIKLQIGDKILLYTDGITEARDHNGIQFGIEGILDQVQKDPDNILAEIEEKFIIHSWGEQNDDYALVLVEVID